MRQILFEIEARQALLREPISPVCDTACRQLELEHLRVVVAAHIGKPAPHAPPTLHFIQVDAGTCNSGDTVYRQIDLLLVSMSRTSIQRNESLFFRPPMPP